MNTVAYSNWYISLNKYHVKVADGHQIGKKQQINVSFNRVYKNAKKLFVFLYIKKQFRLVINLLNVINFLHKTNICFYSISDYYFLALSKHNFKDNLLQDNNSLCVIAAIFHCRIEVTGLLLCLTHCRIEYLCPASATQKKCTQYPRAMQKMNWYPLRYSLSFQFRIAPHLRKSTRNYLSEHGDYKGRIREFRPSNHSFWKQKAISKLSVRCSTRWTSSSQSIDPRHALVNRAENVMYLDDICVTCLSPHTNTYT